MVWHFHVIQIIFFLHFGAQTQVWTSKFMFCSNSCSYYFHIIFIFLWIPGLGGYIHTAIFATQLGPHVFSSQSLTLRHCMSADGALHSPYALQSTLKCKFVPGSPTVVKPGRQLFVMINASAIVAKIVRMDRRGSEVLTEYENNMKRM